MDEDGAAAPKRCVQGGSTENTAALRSLLWAAALSISLTRFVGVSNVYIYSTDEAAYYSAAMLTAEGAAPYADFFYAHPPGLLFLEAALIKAGMRLPELRFVYCGLGVLVPIATAFLVARLASHRQSLAPPLAALMVALAELYQKHSRFVLPDVPAVAFMLAAAGFFFDKGRRSASWAGGFLSAALLFKLQAVVVIPWFVFGAFICWDRREAVRRLIQFFLVLGVVGGAGFLLLTSLLPHSFDCIVEFHQKRPRVSLIGRLQLARPELLSMDIGLGLLSSALCLVHRNSAMRTCGLSVAVIAAMITFFPNSFFDYYYFYLIPFAALASAMMLNSIAESELFSTVKGPLVAICLVLSALHSPTLAAQMTASQRQHSKISEFQKWLADLPGERLMTTNVALVILSGKRAVPDYYAADPCAAALVGEFDEWVARTAPRSDVIVVNDSLLHFLGPNGIRVIRDSGKAIRFHRDADAKDWQAIVEKLNGETQTPP